MRRLQGLVRVFLAVLACGFMFGPGAAFAHGPIGGANSNDITGTWVVGANATRGVLNVTMAQDGAVTGNIFNDAIEGTYNSTTRRLVFVRKDSNGTPIQLYEANISGDGSRIGGSLIVWSGDGGSNSGTDFGFLGTKVENVVSDAEAPTAITDTGSTADISGSWEYQANNDHSHLTNGPFLEITQDGNAISGSMFGTNTIEGFYLPASRRLVFVRKDAQGSPIQFFEAFVATNGSTMAGKMQTWTPAGGVGAQGADFNFSAVRN